MDIYLCKIVECGGSPCIIKRPNATTNEDYIAISHVWGDPKTISKIDVAGAGKVSLSPGKKDILSILRRPDICGESWFWMDLFCIDQTPSATISISDQLSAIPLIYKSSRCVKVLIESPVCEDWYRQAIRTDTYRDWCSSTWKTQEEAAAKHADVFRDFELHHARKCPCMLYYDPWFDRLWTRQEGLYAANLDFIVLNVVACLRYGISQSTEKKWVAEGHSSSRRDKVFTFIDDKLKYHGAPRRDGYRIASFFNMVYARHLNINQFEGQIGPVPGYSPIDGAWRSNRTTTKARDYVLAVFPDVKGYKIPSKGRANSFQELLLDAITQLGGGGPLIAFKVIDAMTKPSTQVEEKIAPFIWEIPESISEAFDTFTTLDSGPRDALTPKFAAAVNPQVVAMSAPVTLETVELTHDALPTLVSLWNSTANNLCHFLSACVSGPCLANNRGMSLESLCFRHLAFEFSKVRIEEWSSTQKSIPESAHGVADWVRLKKAIGDDECAVLIKRFLACLICGCSLRTAKEILLFSEFRVIGSPFGKLLALVSKIGLAIAETEEYVLVDRGLLNFEGFHVALRRRGEDRYRVVGRTWIPKRPAHAPVI